MHLRFLQLVTRKLTAMSAAKRSRPDARQFESWTADVFGFVCCNDGAVCTVHSAVKMLLASSIKRHFKTYILICIFIFYYIFFSLFISSCHLERPPVS